MVQDIWGKADLVDLVEAEESAAWAASQEVASPVEVSEAAPGKNANNDTLFARCI